MSGENNLSTLLHTMSPILNAGEYVFACIDRHHHIPEHEILGSFMEAEGKTVIISKELADLHAIEYDFVSSWITLSVHSSLSAVGLTAAFATALTESNISCNVVAGFYHEHIFVNCCDAEKAMQTLTKLSQQTMQ